MGKIDFSEEFSVNITGNTTLIELLEQGNYRFKHHQINEENFPFNIKVDKNDHRLFLCYLDFGKEIGESDEEYVRSVIKSQGLKPSSIQELMYFNKKYDSFLDILKVVALGSVYKPKKGYDSNFTLYSSYSKFPGKPEISGKYLDILWTDLLCVGKNIAVLTTPNC